MPGGAVRWNRPGYAIFDCGRGLGGGPAERIRCGSAWYDAAVSSKHGDKSLHPWRVLGGPAQRPRELLDIPYRWAAGQLRVVHRPLSRCPAAVYSV
jgi:hypothetical protein